MVRARCDAIQWLNRNSIAFHWQWTPSLSCVHSIQLAAFRLPKIEYIYIFDEWKIWIISYYYYYIIAAAFFIIRSTIPFMFKLMLSPAGRLVDVVDFVIESWGSFFIPDSKNIGHWNWKDFGSSSFFFSHRLEHNNGTACNKRNDFSLKIYSSGCG